MSDTYHHCPWCDAWFLFVKNEQQPTYRPAEWCGKCDVGRRAQFLRYTLDQIIAMRNELRRQYDGDPLPWDGWSVRIEADESADNVRQYRHENIEILEQELRSRAYLP